MFSIHLAEPERRQSPRPSLAQRLTGKVLGFLAGLVVIAAFDEFLLHSRIWQAVSPGLGLNHPSLMHALAGLWASLGAG